MVNPINVLILCTGNSARSILGEALVTKLGAGRLQGFSAGSQPAGKVNPFAIELLEAKGFDTSGYHSKSWDVFETTGAPRMDFVFTVCDSAASEACPVWPGHPVSAHWGLADPAAVTGSDADKRAAFEAAYAILHHRIAQFAALPLETMDREALKTKLKEIGRSLP